MVLPVLVPLPAVPNVVDTALASDGLESLIDVLVFRRRPTGSVYTRET